MLNNINDSLSKEKKTKSTSKKKKKGLYRDSKRHLELSIVRLMATSLKKVSRTQE